MPVTYRKQDELEKLMENFAIIPDPEQVTLPDEKTDSETDK